MSVLAWASHHRLLVGAVGVAVVLLGLVVVLWVLWHRTSTTPVSERQALRTYRAEQRSGVAEPGLPPSGVYRYRTTGSERLSAGGVRRTFPSETDVIVTVGRCASLDWVPLEQHTEQLTECRTHGGIATPGSSSTEQLAGLSTTAPITCGPDTTLVPFDPVRGSTWRSSCRTDGDPVALEASVVGITSVAVGDVAVPAVHVRVDLEFRGSQTGTNPCDYWISSDGMVLREQEQVDLSQSLGPLGTVHYSERMTITLESTAPER